MERCDCFCSPATFKIVLCARQTLCDCSIISTLIYFSARRKIQFCRKRGAGNKFARVILIKLCLRSSRVSEREKLQPAAECVTHNTDCSWEKQIAGVPNSHKCAAIFISQRLGMYKSFSSPLLGKFIRAAAGKTWSAGRMVCVRGAANLHRWHHQAAPIVPGYIMNGPAATRPYWDPHLLTMPMIFFHSSEYISSRQAGLQINSALCLPAALYMWARAFKL